MGVEILGSIFVFLMLYVAPRKRRGSRNAITVGFIMCYEVAPRKRRGSRNIVDAIIPSINMCRASQEAWE